MVMIVLFHVLVALSSIVLSTYLFFRPSHTGLHVSYGLIGLTLASGTVLVVSQPVHILQTCISGVFYLGGVLGATFVARHKLAVQEN